MGVAELATALRGEARFFTFKVREADKGKVADLNELCRSSCKTFNYKNSFPSLNIMALPSRWFAATGASGSILVSDHDPSPPELSDSPSRHVSCFRLMRKGAMTIRVAVVFGLMVVCCFTEPAEAQRLTGRGLRGEIDSANAVVPPGGLTTVYVVPGDRHFVLKQACFAGGGMTLAGEAFGKIVRNGDPCTTYTPGIVISPNDALSCSNPNGVPVECMITGVLTR
jgi:hypothetical protein